MGKNKKVKASGSKAEKSSGGEDSEPLVSNEEEDDIQTDITSPDNVSVVDDQPSTPADNVPVQEQLEISAAVDVNEVVIESSTIVAEESNVLVTEPVTVSVVEISEERPTVSVQVTEPEQAASPDQTSKQTTEQIIEPVVEQATAESTEQKTEPVVEQNKEATVQEQSTGTGTEPITEQTTEVAAEPTVKSTEQSAEPAAEEPHERTYAEVVASNIPEPEAEHDSANEDHPLLEAGSSKNPSSAKVPDFDETSELTVEPVVAAPAEAAGQPLLVEKEDASEPSKEDSSFFTCLSSFKFW